MNSDPDTTLACDIESLLTRLETAFLDAYPDALITVDANPATVDVDPDICRIVIKELVDNAVKHNEKETPTVTVTVDGPEKSNGRVTIRIADNGPGIPEHERTAVQIGTDDPLMHGSGIGLSHVHWVVTDYGGEIKISENEPQGTVVTLSLPAAQA